MDIATIIIGSLGLIAAVIAAYYAYKTFTAGQEPRLALRYTMPYFTLRNIGTTAARNIIEKNGCFNINVLELFNYSGPVNVGQTGSSAVAINFGATAAVNALGAGQEKIALFEYENLSGERFRSEFAIKRSKNPNDSEQFTAREIKWKKI
jgi:hypothetical protein